MDNVKKTPGFSIIGMCLLILIIFLNACSNVPLALPDEEGITGETEQVTVTATPTGPHWSVTILPITPNTTNVVPNGTVPIKAPLAPTEITETSTALVATAITAVVTVTAQPATETPTPLTPKNVTLSPTVLTVYPTTSWQPPEPLSKEAVADWLVYTDKAAGYSFKYPPDAIVSSEVTLALNFKETQVIFQATDSPQARMFIWVTENQENLTTQEYLATLNSRPSTRSDHLTDIEQIQINNLSGIWYKASNSSEMDIVLVSEEKIFSFNIVNFSNFPDRRKMSEANKNLAYQTLNTFTIFP